MIRHISEKNVVAMSLVDLEHCGFDHDGYMDELFLNGIEANQATLWPMAIIVNVAGGCVITPDTRPETREQTIQNHEKFEHWLSAALDRADRIAVLERALRDLLKAGPCDECYEDKCDPVDCQCACHKWNEQARRNAQAALGAV